MPKHPKVTEDFLRHVKNECVWRDDCLYLKSELEGHSGPGVPMHSTRLVVLSAESGDRRAWGIGASVPAGDHGKWTSEARKTREDVCRLLRRAEALPDGRFMSGAKVYWLVDKDGYAVAEPC
ncbi:hypothetical protein [Sorangium sp. So ce1078]|uniref:hypothetical protein n=1 Tax=Sorangium sp. So ce1078 TaxID=3133329 RepID=UPI003F61D19D